jgi:cyclophilin family peptidyl-prolyl cis-trans isomerase
MYFMKKQTQGSNIIKISLLVFILFSCFSCNNNPKSNQDKPVPPLKKDSLTTIKPKVVKKAKGPIITKETAIPYLQQFEKENQENKVRVTTEFGSFEITLNKYTPYHRANMIFLTKQKYYNGSLFHRIVNGFIIQGGNSDSRKLARKRTAIGRYLLPPEIKSNYKHTYGAVSMPSSENENPHKFSSPYEFFIVQAKNGSPHLDGSHTVFGFVTSGMDVVDTIAAQETDGQEWPLRNISMTVEVID